MKNRERYTALCLWARNRYTRPDGSVVISTGGVPSAYRRIDNAAAVKYLGCDPLKLEKQA